MRVGRGGKKGAYSGRGMKGQRSRAGRKMQPSIRELIKKFPKLRGYKSERFLDDSVIVSLSVLAEKFSESEIISPKSLLEKRIIRRIKGRAPKVKVLGRAELKKPLSFEDCRFSKEARESVEKAGGKIK